MKDEAEIRKKYKELRYRHLKRHLKSHLSSSPSNCVHNLECETPEGPARLCMLGAEDPENWPGNICDTLETAQKCPFFQSKHEKAELKEEFEQDMSDAKTVYHDYRDLAMLLWALEEEPKDQEVHLSWWKRLRLWFMRSD
jgi:hypothetical protein